MERLKGKTILIGREQGQGRLLVAVSGTGKTAAIGTLGSVPDCVSRCKPSENSAHVKITVDWNGNIIISNMKPQNVTFVNGSAIETKKISVSDEVKLGRDQYPLNLPNVLGTAKDIVGQAPISIRHLKAIWEKYDSAVLELQDKQQKKANQQRLQGLISMSGMLLAILPGVVGGELPGWVQVLRIVLVIAAIGLGIYFFIKGAKVKDSFHWKMHELDQKFITDYVCPNKECRHYMGKQPYSILSQNKKCPYCGCKYLEE